MTMSRIICKSFQSCQPRVNQRYQLLLSSAFSTCLRDSYETIIVSREDGSTTATSSETGTGGLGVGIIKLNQPRTLNALSDSMFDDLIHASRAFDEMDDVGSIVITGEGKAFAAGASIKEMSNRDFAYAYKSNMFSQWAQIGKLSKPTIAAVNGYALGGGCELAMMCDIILASSHAKFSQPEINLGIIPGAGGTQRLVRSIGKSKAMEMILTAQMIDAKTAERYGLISRVVEEDNDGNGVLEEAVKMGLIIGTKGQIAVMMAKEAINAADEMTLEEGLKFERRIFHALFATRDQKQGMSAFLSNRSPEFTHE